MFLLLYLHLLGAYQSIHRGLFMQMNAILGWILVREFNVILTRLATTYAILIVGVLISYMLDWHQSTLSCKLGFLGDMEPPNLTSI